MHVSPEEIQRFQEQSMNTEDMISFLEHIDNCNYCLEQMLDFEEDFHIPEAPAYLKEQILSHAATPRIQAEKARHTFSYRLQLFYCGVKTTAGVLMALLLLFSVSNMDFAGLASNFTIQKEHTYTQYLSGQHPDYLYQFSQRINQELTDNSEALASYLDDFSSKLFNGGK